MTHPAQLPLRPVGYYLLVRERKAERTSKGGILIAPEAQDAQQYLTTTGTVAAMGDSCYAHREFQGRPWCELGTRVLFHKHAGLRIDTVSPDPGEDDIRYRLLKDNDILAVIDDPDAIKASIY